MSLPLSLGRCAPCLLLLAAALPAPALAHAEHGDHARSVSAAQAPGIPAGQRAPAPVTWTSQPRLLAQLTRDGEPGLQVRGSGSEFSTVWLQTPEQPQAVALRAENGRWLATKTQLGSGGHLWLEARHEHGQQEIRSSTYVFFPAKHHVPTAMLRSPRGGLEIVPLRLQEHGGTREGSHWQFLLRYANQPLPNHPLLFETEGGSRETLHSDAAGVVELVFPHDFRRDKLQSKEGMAARQEFVLSTTHSAAGRQFLTTYNHTYNPDRMRERSLAAGIGVFALGALLAVPLWRRRPGKEKANA